MERILRWLVLLILLPAGVARGQEGVFSDDFEWGSTCAWSNDVWFPDVDADNFGDDSAAGEGSDCPPPADVLLDDHTDCDDDDPNVNPGQSAWFSVPAANGGWDYDCDGVEEKRWGAVGGCSAADVCVMTAPGFSNAQECGASGSYIADCSIDCEYMFIVCPECIEACTPGCPPLFPGDFCGQCFVHNCTFSILCNYQYEERTQECH